MAKNRIYNMREIREVFDRIYPTTQQLHMNIIAQVVFHTDFKKLLKDRGIHYDYYQIQYIREGCEQTLQKSNNSKA